MGKGGGEVEGRWRGGGAGGGGAVGGSCTSPDETHNGNHNSINTFYIYCTSAHAEPRTHKQRGEERRRRRGRLFSTLPIDPVTVTAAPVGGPVK